MMMQKTIIEPVNLATHSKNACKNCLWWNRNIGMPQIGKCEREFINTFCEHSCNGWEDAIDIAEGDENGDE